MSLKNKMKVWHIWDFPESVYVFLKDNFREEFFNEMFKKCAGIRPYARYLGVNQMTIKNYFKGHTYKRGIKHKQSIPLTLFRKSLNLMTEDLKKKVEDNIVSIKLKNRGLEIKDVELPFRESPDFYRAVAHILCDGSSSDKSGAYYANTCKELREEFKRDLNVFGNMKIYEIKPQDVTIVCFPKVLARTLAHILKIRFTYPDHLPKDIFNASNGCKAAFLRAVFDDEGTISTNLAVGMFNRNLIEEIKSLLGFFNIETTLTSIKKSDKWQDNYSFNVKTKYFSKFDEIIGFTSEDKAKKLKLAVNTRQRMVRTRPKALIEEQIIKILEAKPSKTIEIANSVELTLGYLSKFLGQMEEEGKIVKSGFSNNLKWSLPMDATNDTHNS